MPNASCAAPLVGCFAYTSIAPQVTGLTPTSGYTTHSTSITITGSGFINGATVTMVQESSGSPNSAERAAGHRGPGRLEQFHHHRPDLPVHDRGSVVLHSGDHLVGRCESAHRRARSSRLHRHHRKAGGKMKLGRKERTATITKGTSTKTTRFARERQRSHDRPRGRRASTSPRNRAPRPTPGAEPFGGLLVRRGFVSEDDVAQALIVQEESGKRLGETLVDMGALNERELILVLADLLHMPVVDLRRDNPDPDALGLIPEQMVREHMAMPIRLDDDGLQVAVLGPAVGGGPGPVHASDGSPDPLRPRTRLRYPMGHRQQLPGHRWRRRLSSRPSRRSRAIADVLSRPTRLRSSPTTHRSCRSSPAS